ncbi:hypothetical protein GCM10029992_07210 [Glycomyces albus]
MTGKLHAKESSSRLHRLRIVLAPQTLDPEGNHSRRISPRASDRSAAMNPELPPIQRRTVQIIAHRGDDRFSLTGFVIAERLVLTCAHDIVDADTLEVGAGVHHGRLRPARVIWRPDPTGRLDVAVLSVPALNAPIDAPIAWGELAGITSAVAGYGYGYPKANRDTRDEGPAGGHHVAPIEGDIVPGEGIERGRLVLKIEPGQVPDDEAWSGYSGMAVFDGDDRLLGVVSARLTGWHNRWDLVPAAQISRAAGLPKALRELPRRTIRDDSLLEPAYHPHTGVPTDLKLLTARYGQVPFVGGSHRPYLDELLGWATGTDGDRYSISVLTGQAGSGKTRLAAELCTELLSEHTDWETGFATTERDAEWSEFIPRRPTLAVFDYSDRSRSRANVIAWLGRLDKEFDASPRVRILLVERTPGAWLSELNHRTGGVVSELRRGGLDLDLRGPPGASAALFDAERRREHARAAHWRFRTPEEQNLRAVDELLEFVADDKVDSPLLVHIAALLAARDRPLPNRTDTDPEGLRDRLLADLLSRERNKRWREHPTLNQGALPTDDQVLHAVCIANLTKPDLHELDDLLTASPSGVLRHQGRGASRARRSRLRPLSRPEAPDRRPTLRAHDRPARTGPGLRASDRLASRGRPGGHHRTAARPGNPRPPYRANAPPRGADGRPLPGHQQGLRRHRRPLSPAVRRDRRIDRRLRRPHPRHTAGPPGENGGLQVRGHARAVGREPAHDRIAVLRGPARSRRSGRATRPRPAVPSPNRQIAELGSQLATLAVRHLEQSGASWDLSLRLNELGYRLGNSVSTPKRYPTFSEP